MKLDTTVASIVFMMVVLLKGNGLMINLSNDNFSFLFTKYSSTAFGQWRVRVDKNAFVFTVQSPILN
jgi:hypothetical protein